MILTIRVVHLTPLHHILHTLHHFLKIRLLQGGISSQHLLEHVYLRKLSLCHHWESDMRRILSRSEESIGSDNILSRISGINKENSVVGVDRETGSIRGGNSNAQGVARGNGP